MVPEGATPFITNSSNPKGGVVKLISNDNNMIRANQTRSKPSDCARGKKIGTVSSIIEICSINIPSKSRTANMIINIANGARSNDVAHFTNPREAPEKANSWLKVAEPNTIK